MSNAAKNFDILDGLSVLHNFDRSTKLFFWFVIQLKF